jgi:hypothetical protein
VGLIIGSGFDILYYNYSTILNVKLSLYIPKKSSYDNLISLQA